MIEQPGRVAMGWANGQRMPQTLVSANLLCLAARLLKLCCVLLDSRARSSVWCGPPPMADIYNAEFGAPGKGKHSVKR